MKVYACDFETTTDNPDRVDVWSACVIEVGECVLATDEKCIHFWNIADFIGFVKMQTEKDATRWYFHNLKFDGSYILDYLDKNGEQYTDKNGALKDHKPGTKAKTAAEKMKADTYSYTVSDTNVMYSITYKCGANIASFRDSYKLLPFPLHDIAESFETKHKKLEMNFNGKHLGYIPTDEEIAYINNDVLVLKEALEIAANLLNCPVTKLPLTIGSVSLNYFKQTIDENWFIGYNFRKYFPRQTNYIDNDKTMTYDEYVRRSYHGGWCYVKPEIQGKVINSPGYTYDVNSLYPSVMHSISGCFYPIGKGKIKSGDLNKWERDSYNRGCAYYFIRFRCNFEIKKGHLPTVQIKGDPLYDGTEWLKTSKVYDYCADEWIENAPIITMTCTDYELFLEHYNVENMEIYDHMTYRTMRGIFDDFIEHWYNIKSTHTGAMRHWAKLVLNNCYGKFATAPNGDYIKYEDIDGVLHGKVIEQDDPNRAVYIPIGAAITSWARCFTIRHAQANYNAFCYADTDSIHCIGKKEDAKDITEHPTALCAWKCESTWDKAIFAGQKRYIEHTEDGNNIKCCGMGKDAKNNLEHILEDNNNDYSIFRPGLVVPGNTRSRRIAGGIMITEQPFTFRDEKFLTA